MPSRRAGRAGAGTAIAAAAAAAAAGAAAAAAAVRVASGPRCCPCGVALSRRRWPSRRTLLRRRGTRNGGATAAAATTAATTSSTAATAATAAIAAAIAARARPQLRAKLLHARSCAVQCSCQPGAHLRDVFVDLVQRLAQRGADRTLPVLCELQRWR